MLRSLGYHKSAQSIEEDEPNRRTDGVQNSTVEADGKVVHVVWVQKIELENHEVMGTYWHEIFHLALAICEEKNIDVDASGSNETPAYIGGYYYAAFLKKLLTGG